MSVLTSRRTYAALAVFHAGDAVACAIPVPYIAKILDSVEVPANIRWVFPVVKAAAAVGLASVYRFPALARLTTALLTVYFALAVGAHLRVGATQRLGRTLLLEAAPELTYLSGTGVGAGLDLRLQFRRLIESDNGVALLEGATGPGAGRGFVAGGAEYQLNRRGLPSLTAALLLGSGPSGFAPGVRASASGEVARFSYRAEVAAEPYRATAPPYRANVAVGTALGPGALGLEFGAALANDFGVPPVLLRGSYAFRF